MYKKSLIFFILVCVLLINIDTNSQDTNLPKGADVIVNEAKSNLRIMIVIPEVHIGRRVPDPAGETEMIRKFLDKGFRLVDQKQIAAIRDSQSVRAALKGDDKAAILLGKKFGAEVIIIGEAFSEENPSGSMAGLASCRARVEARAINVDTGEIIAADGRQAGGVDATWLAAGKTALRNAASALADYMISQIETRWNTDVIRGNNLTIIVHIIGNNKFKKFSDFKISLQKIDGYEGINTRDFDSDIGQAELDLKIRAFSAQEIAGELDGLRTKKGFIIHVIKVTGNTIEVSIK